MKRKLKVGTTSHREPIRVDDTSSTTGAGLTGLVYNSSGLTARYWRDGDAAWTTVPLVAGTLGTYVSGGFAEMGRGKYEFCPPNAALSQGKWVVFELYGATNMAPVEIFFELDQLDYQDAAAAGLSRLDATVSSRLATTGYTAPDNAGISAAAGSAATAATEATGANTKAGAVQTILSGITSLGHWLRLLARKTGGDATALSELNLGGGTFAQSTDSLEGSVDTGGAGLTPAQVWAHAQRTLTQSAAQVTEVVRGSTIVIPRGDRVVIPLTGLGSLAGHTQIWFTVKTDPKNDTDSAAILQVAKTGGLLYLNGAVYGTPGDATLVVDDESAGNLTITLAAAATKQLAPVEKLTYDVQVLFATGPVTKTSGRCDISADVTRAVS